MVRCETFILKNNSEVEFRLKGKVQFKDFKEHAAVCTATAEDKIHSMHEISLNDTYLLYRILVFFNDILETTKRSNLGVLYKLTTTETRTFWLLISKR